MEKIVINCYDCKGDLFPSGLVKLEVGVISIACSCLWLCLHLFEMVGASADCAQHGPLRCPWGPAQVSFPISAFLREITPLGQTAPALYTKLPGD